MDSIITLALSVSVVFEINHDRVDGLQHTLETRLLPDFFLLVADHVHNLSEVLAVARFEEYFVHAAVQRSLDVNILHVAGDADNDGLEDASIEEVLSDFTGGFVSIHKWHVTVHQDETVVAEIFVICFYVFDDHLESFFSIKSFVANLVDIYLNDHLKYDT